jgi:hypothetical protein
MAAGTGFTVPPVGCAVGQQGCVEKVVTLQLSRVHILWGSLLRCEQVTLHAPGRALRQQGCVLWGSRPVLCSGHSAITKAAAGAQHRVVPVPSRFCH